MSETLTKEMAQRLIEVSGWFTVSPADVREAIKAIASGAHIVVPASDVQQGRDAAELQKQIAWEILIAYHDHFKQNPRECKEPHDLAAKRVIALLAAAQSPPSRWMPIESAPKDRTPVDLWLQIHASPRSMGMSDAYRVTDCWFKDGHWVHYDRGEVRVIYTDYITHWQPIQPPPAAAPEHAK